MSVVEIHNSLYSEAWNIEANAQNLFFYLAIAGDQNAMQVQLMTIKELPKEKILELLRGMINTLEGTASGLILPPSKNIIL